jgi:hypothetical protein
VVAGGLKKTLGWGKEGQHIRARSGLPEYLHQSLVCRREILEPATKAKYI